MMKIINKQAISIKDIDFEQPRIFDEEKIKYFGSRLDFETKKIEYFIEVKDCYYPYIVSKEEFKQFKKYMEEERNIVWGNEDE